MLHYHRPDPWTFYEKEMQSFYLGCGCNATDEEVIAAARLANADGFIRRLPDGYNTMLRNNGANLSQDQYRRICYCRPGNCKQLSLSLA